MLRHYYTIDYFLFQVNSQLMEAVKQKISLSEELEDMEMKMERLLQEQVVSNLARSQSTTESENYETLSRKISKPMLALFGM